LAGFQSLLMNLGDWRGLLTRRPPVVFGGFGTHLTVLDHELLGDEGSPVPQVVVRRTESDQLARWALVDGCGSS
jgi:hypothetical protein